MAGRKVELAGHEGFTLSEYAWRGGWLKSPLTKETMRGVVGKDEKQRYRPGILVSDGKCAQTTFDVEPARTREDAISKSRAMLRERLVDHAREVAELNQRPGEIVDVWVESRALAIAEGREHSSALKYGGRAGGEEVAQEREKSLKL